MTTEPDTRAATAAATLVVMRRGAGGLPELLMVERGAKLAFAAGALVFPGGRVDPQDFAHAAADELDRDDAAARVAAIRETIEEAGVAVALDPPPDARTVARLRAGLATGGDFARLLAGEGLALDLAALTPLTRWRPDHKLARVFDTRFYLARAPEGAVADVGDGIESARSLWTTAAAALAEADAGRHLVIFPTRRNLERLAPLASFEEAVALAERYPAKLVSPWLETHDGVDWLCIPEDLGYPVTREALTTVRRG